MAGTFGVPELSPDGRWVSCIDSGNNRLRVVALSDGAEVATIELPSIPLSLLALGRSRWLPGSSTLVWLDYDSASAATRLVAQEIVRGPRHALETPNARAGHPRLDPESFAISPDGSRLLVSVDQSRSDLLLVDGSGGHPLIGARLGPYEITAPLGEGGMGVVYRATDTKLKREVAIKVLPEAFAADADRLARFEREAQVLAQLQHPNIASIYGLEESNGVRALVHGARRRAKTSPSG